MAKLTETFPELAKELGDGLRLMGRTDLADQVGSAEVKDVSFDSDVSAGNVYLEPSQGLNVVEANVIGSRYRTSISVDTPFGTVVDLDNYGRVTSIEVLAPGSLAAELERQSRASSAS